MLLEVIPELLIKPCTLDNNDSKLKKQKTIKAKRKKAKKIFLFFSSLLQLRHLNGNAQTNNSGMIISAPLDPPIKIIIAPKEKGI